VRLKQVICCGNFATRRRRRRIQLKTSKKRGIKICRLTLCICSFSSTLSSRVKRKGNWRNPRNKERKPCSWGRGREGTGRCLSRITGRCQVDIEFPGGMQQRARITWSPIAYYDPSKPKMGNRISSSRRYGIHPRLRFPQREKHYTIPRSSKSWVWKGKKCFWPRILNDVEVVKTAALCSDTNHIKVSYIWKYQERKRLPNT
jgi:hypothetical protein